MNKSKITAIIALNCLTGIVQASDTCTVNQLEWLNGHWHTKSDDKHISEQWQTVSEQTMEGVGFSRKAGEDVVVYESLRILEMSGDLYLLAKVAHNAMPTPFKASECLATSVLFENPEHDFPNRLHYVFEDEKLVVDVRNNENRGFSLSFRREAISPD